MKYFPITFTQIDQRMTQFHGEGLVLPGADTPGVGGNIGGALKAVTGGDAISYHSSPCSFERYGSFH